jgi:trans-aconitate 2-methyltransferase
MGWEPDRYLQFSDERLRPAMDLLGRVPLLRPGRIVDLGWARAT